jgi:hypothetical protein
MLTDEQRASLAARFKARWLPRIDSVVLRASEEAQADHHQMTRLALGISAWFEEEMRKMEEK